MRTLLIWGPRVDVDSWTNELEEHLAETLGWEVHRAPRTGDEAADRRETLALAAEVGAEAFLTNHVAWTGGPSRETLDAYREGGMVTVAISHDEPYRAGGYDNRAWEQAPGYDLWLTNWDEPGFLARHPAGRVVVSPCAARRPFRPSAYGRPDIGIGFLGVYYEPREAFLRAVADLGLTAHLIARTEPPFHAWPPPPAVLACVPKDAAYLRRPEGVARFCRRSVTSLDLSQQPDGRVKGAKNRLFEALASGSFTLSERSAQAERLFREGEEVVFFETPEELRRLYLEYLARAEERARIAAAGATAALAGHTWQHRAAQISREIEAELERREGAPALDVGVVIPTKDRPELLTRAVLSAMGVPMVVVDTGDEPADPRAWRWASSCRPTLLRAAGAGPGEARNAGWRTLGTEWVQFLDDDDVLRVGWRAAFARVAEEADVIVGAAVSTDRRDRGWISPEAPYTSQLCVRQEWLARVGGFDAGVPVAEERDLLRRLDALGARIRLVETATATKGGEDIRGRMVVRGRAEALPARRGPLVGPPVTGWGGCHQMRGER